MYVHWLLTVALAGYLGHEVDKTVLFMIPDSIKASDQDRIARFVEFSMDTNYLVIALLEDEAEAVASEYPKVSII